MTYAALLFTGLSLICSVFAGFYLGIFTGRIVDVIKFAVVAATFTLLAIAGGVPEAAAIGVANVATCSMLVGTQITHRLRPVEEIHTFLTTACVIAIIVDLCVVAFGVIMFFSGTSFGTH